MTAASPVLGGSASSTRVALSCVLAFAFAARVYGAFGQGLPFAYFGDEASFVKHALYLGAMGTADPGWFNKPALTYYLLFALAGGIFVVGKAFRFWPDVESFGAFAIDNPAPFLVAGRVMNAIFSTGVVWIVYLVGKRLRGRAFGVLAAAIAAVIPGEIAAARVVKEDAALAFFMAAATLAALDVAEKRRAKDYLRTGLLAGLATAAKFNGAALAIPAAFAAAFPFSSATAGGTALRAWLKTTLMGGAFLGAFFCGSPYVFLNPRFYEGQLKGRLEQVRGIVGEGPALLALGVGVVAAGAWFVRRRSRARAGGGPSTSAILVAACVATGAASAAPQFDAYGRMGDAAGVFGVLERLLYGLKSLTIGHVDPAGERYGLLGTALSIAAAAGALFVVFRGSKGERFFLVAALGHALFAVAGRQLPEPRHLIGAAPFAACFAALAATRLAAFFFRAPSSDDARTIVAAGVVVAGLAALPSNDPVPLRGSLAGAHVRLATLAYADDPRTRALRFLEREAAPGATILNMHEVLPLRMNVERVRFMAERQRGILPGDPKSHQRGFGRMWSLLESAAKAPGRPTFDVACVIMPWQVESGDDVGRRRATEGVQNYWPVEAAARPLDVPPIERYRRVPWADDGGLSDATIGEWPAARVLRPGTRADWLAASEVTYDNYVRPEKRARFPDFAAFFDDLKAHYDAFEFAPVEGGPGRVVRVYDLRRRRAEGEARVVRMPDP